MFLINLFYKATLVTKKLIFSFCGDSEFLSWWACLCRWPFFGLYQCV